MTAQGGNIKVTLVLDENGFTVKTKNAAQAARVLEQSLGKAGKASKETDSGISKLGKTTDAIADRLSALDKSLGSFASRMEAVAARMERVGQAGARVRKSNQEIAKSLSPVEASLKRTAESASTYAVAIESIKPSIGRMLAAQGALNKSTRESAKAARDAAQSFGKSKEDMLHSEVAANTKLIAERRRANRELSQIEQKFRDESEGKLALAIKKEKQLGPWGSKNVTRGLMNDASRLEGNASAVANMRATYSREVEALTQRNVAITESIRLRRAEAAAAAESAAKQMAADRAAAIAKRQLNEDWAAASKINEKMNRQVELAHAKAIVENRKLDAKLQEGVNRAHAQAIAENARREAAAAKEVAKAAKAAEMERSRLVKENAKVEKRERLETEREVAREQRIALVDQRREIRQNMSLWKSMASLYAGAKINQGIGTVIDKSAERQSLQARVASWNMPAGEEAEFYSKARQLRQQEKYLSNADAVQARFTAMTSVGYNNQGVIDGTLREAVQTAQALKFQGYEQNDMTNILRNLYGVAEARQQMRSPDDIKKTFDMLYRISSISGGKINIADVETVLRNLGPAASLISTKGLLDVVALAEQMKVSGGHGTGGAGTGISSVGTMLKMVQLYAAGKPMALTAMEQMFSAGLIDSPETVNKLQNMTGSKEQSAMKAAFGGPELRKSLKGKGFVNKEQLWSDPVEYFRGAREQMLKFMLASEENRAQYFGDKDFSKEKLLAAAGGDQTAADEKYRMGVKTGFGNFFARSGFSHRAVTGLQTLVDEDFLYRSGKVTDSAMKGMSAAEILEYAEGTKNWRMATQELSAAWEDLAMSFVPVVEQLVPTVKLFSDFLRAGSQWAENNPMAAGMGLVSTAVMGATLAFKGMMGITGKLASVIGGLQLNHVASSFATARKEGDGFVGTLKTMAGQGANAVKGTFAPIGVAARDASIATQAAALAMTSSSTSIGTKSKAVAGAFGSIIKGAMTTARVVGGTFLRMIPLVGQLILAWDIGSWIYEWVKDWTIWGDTIEGHVKDTFASIVDLISKAVLKVRKIWASNPMFGTPEEMAEFDRRIAEIEERGKQRGVEKTQRQDAIEAGKFADSYHAERNQYVAEQAGYKSYAELEAARVRGGRGAKKEGEKNADALKGFNPLAQITQPATKEKPEWPDLVKRFMETNKLALTEAEEGMSALKSGEPDFAARARAIVEKQILAFDLSDAKNPKNTPFMKRGYDKIKPFTAEDIDWSKKSYNGLTATDMATGVEEKLRAEAALKAATAASERFAAANEEASEAAANFAEFGIAKETAALRALRKEYAKIETGAGNVGDDPLYANAKAGSFAQASRNEMFKQTATMRDSNDQLAASLVTDPMQRTREEYKKTVAEAERTASMLTAQINRYYDEWIAANAGNQAEIERINGERNQALAGFNSEFMRQQELLAKQLAENLKTPVEKLADEWAKIYDQMDQAQSQWASGFLDTLADALNTGELKWRDYAASVLRTIQDMMLKQAMGSFVTDFAKQGGDWLLGQAQQWLGLGARGNTPLGVAAQGGLAGGQAAAPALGQGLSAAAPGIGLTVGGLTADATGKTTEALAGMTSGLKTSGAALLEGTNLQFAANMATTASTVAKEAGTVVESAATTTVATESMMLATNLTGLALMCEWAATAVGNLASASAAGASTAAFADGGIMTSSGPVALKAYANGGIANSPQLALFGEGRTPEAYVPLPDGRTIPVTLKGMGESGGDQVSISISVYQQDGQTKTENTQATGSDAQTWNRMANRIKSIVQEELVTQRRPGGMLY